MDVDAVLARRPKVALVDELAHTNVPGSRNAKRWQDIEELLAAGIDVITTVNIQHLESVNDVVEKITGVPQRETVPDAVVRAADQIELEDMTAEALRRRLAHGNVYAPEKVDAALSNYFRTGNLNALRELALLWTADRVDDALQQYRETARHHRHLGGPGAGRRRADRRARGRDPHPPGRPHRGPVQRRRPARRPRRPVGRTLRRQPGRAGRAATARRVARRHLPPGARRRRPRRRCSPSPAPRTPPSSCSATAAGRRWARLLSPGTAAHTVARVRRHRRPHRHARPHRPRRLAAPRPRQPQHPAQGARLRPRRRAAAAADPGADAVPRRAEPGQRHAPVPPADGRRVALVGGLAPALIAAVAGSVLLNYYFTPPLHTLTISETNNALALLVFVLVATLVSSTVDLAARRTRQAARAAAESRTLANLAGSVLGGEDALVGDAAARPGDLRAHLGHAAGAQRRRLGAGRQRRTGRRPDPATRTPRCPPATGSSSPCAGGSLQAEDQRLIGAFAAQAAVVLDHIRLSRAAAEAAPLAEANKVRAALLAAVGHDFRTPLAAAKAAVSTLLSFDIDLDADDRRELLQAADTSLDRLAALVDNLLDMSRLQAGAMSIDVQPTAVDEVVARALDDLGDAGPPHRHRHRRRPPPGAGRPGPAGAGAGEPRVQRAALLARRDAPAPHQQPARRPGRDPGHRPRTRHSPGRLGPGLPAVPAPRRHRQHHRRRARPRPRPAASPRPWADPSSPRRPPAAASPWSSPCRRSTDMTAGRSRPARTRRGRPMTRVLVVDDEPQLLRALSINLRARHYEVATAANGTEALTVAAAHPPDVVILDLGLPDMDGTEVIAGLRGWTDVPILVLSGRTDSIDKVEALDAGADDYVTKPFGMDELLARLRAMTRRSSDKEEQPVVELRRRHRRPGSPPRHRGPGTTSGSPRPSGTSSRCCSATRASCSANVSSSPRSGARATRQPRETCASTWPSCAASSKPIRRDRATCSTSPAWATASSPDRRARPCSSFA